MKLKFKHQDFQTDDVNAVVDLFAGQESAHSTFSVETGAQVQMSGMNEMGFGNGLVIDDDALLENMHTVQKRNNLPITDDAKTHQFSIEMETGTGKTYVYTKPYLN